MLLYIDAVSAQDSVYVDEVIYRLFYGGFRGNWGLIGRR